MKNFKDFMLVLFTLLFLISTVATICYAIMNIWYAFQNPELTTTQLIIYFFNDTLGGKWAITQAISYLSMSILCR